MKRYCKDGIKVIDISGNRYGRLVVTPKWKTSYSGRKLIKKRAYWLCKCDCGNEKWIVSSSLRPGGTRSCGCIKMEQLKLEPGMASRNRKYRNYRKDAERKGRVFNLTKEQFMAITTSNCFYCGCNPHTIQRAEGNNGDWIHNGIDRVDNDKGYIIDNCVPCCTECNLAKRQMPQKEFYEWVERIYEHLKKENRI